MPNHWIAWTVVVVGGLVLLGLLGWFAGYVYDETHR